MGADDKGHLKKTEPAQRSADQRLLQQNRHLADTARFWSHPYLDHTATDTEIVAAIFWMDHLFSPSKRL